MAKKSLIILIQMISNISLKMTHYDFKQFLKPKKKNSGKIEAHKFTRISQLKCFIMKKTAFKQLDSAICISDNGRIITLFYHSIISIVYDSPYIRVTTNR